MKSRIVIGFLGFAVISALTVACGGSGSTASDLGTSSANRLVLDVRCATNTDCPTGFECDVEVEHGVSTSSCKSHDPVPAGATPTCPAGFEAEPEHGALACKPDGSSGGSGSGGTGGGSAAGSSGADDTAASGGSAAGSSGADDTPSTSTGTKPAGAACTTTADCVAGLECEIDVEHGGTTTVCHLHGGGSSGGGKK